jgi:hypothetical protein
MSLNDKSLVLFGTAALLYMCVYAAMFLSPSLKKFFTLALAWLVNWVATLWYGIVTEQVGFILICGLEVAMIFFVYVITGKVIQDDSV